MKHLTLACATTLAAVLAAPSVPAQTQRTTGPIATYWMTTSTESGLPGLSAMGSGGGFNPMSLLTGGGGQVQKRLLLELQSSRQTDAPSAHHTAAAALGVRAPCPLITAGPPGREERAEHHPSETPEFGRARLLVYSGCGAETRAGQPMVIDISRDGVTGMGRLTQALSFNLAQGPGPGTGRTYGDWLHGSARDPIGPNASLVGTHTISGNYSPDIEVTLTPQQDFMEPIQLTGVAPGDPAGLGWMAVPNATGYFASVMGAAENGDIVIWSSSETPIFPYMMPTWLTEADLTRFKRDRTVLSPETTQCRIPDAVQTGAPQAMLKVQAFGGDVDFAYPPRPADRRQTWNIEYVVKVRYASAVTTMMGMDLSEMSGPDEARRGPMGLPTPPTAGDLARGALGGLNRLRRRN